MNYELRSVKDPAQLEALEDVQRLAWGYDDIEVTPGSLMVASVHSGGIVVAGYLPNTDKALGFAFSFPAVREGRPWQHSHLLAIVPEHRGSGLARQLKMRQRQIALEQGFTRMTWTFDPLVARNARFNLGKLGARAVSYHQDWYSVRGVYAGIPADRFMVEWDFAQESLDQRPSRADGLRVLEHLGNAPSQLRLDASERTLFVAVPREIDAIKRDAPETARAWRQAHRQAFGHYLPAGFAVTDLAVDGEKLYYRLER